MTHLQPELFQDEPPPMRGSAELDFTLTLKDGCEVRVRFKRNFLCSTSHIDFYGDGISSTGYRSHFPGYILNETDDVVKKLCGDFAELLRAERLKKITKEASQKKRREKC